MLKKTGAWIIILSFLFLFAGLAFAAPQSARSGEDIAKLIRSGATEIIVDRPRGTEIFIDRESVFTKAIGTINFNGAAVKVRVPNHAGAFKVDGGKLYLVDYTSFTQSKNWWAIADRSGEILCRKFEHRGTRGVFGIEGVLNLINGKSATREYGIYAGSVDRGDHATVKVYAQDVEFKNTEAKGEAPVRIMGGYGDFLRCSFNSAAMTDTKKESLQDRYGVAGQKMVYTACTFDYSLSLQPLYDKKSDLGIEYRAYSLKVPLDLEFIRCRIRGYTMTGGNTRAKFIDCDFIGRDPRGIGGSTAITTGWAWGVRSKVEAIRCNFNAWKAAGDEGVTIKP